jgi:UDP-3-O-[3-hydroxymyristoyl] glucosamine N-acyltransferase
MKSKEIAEFLGKTLVGEDSEIITFSSLLKVEDCSLLFANKFSSQNVELLNSLINILAIVSEEYQGKLIIPHIISVNPRLDYLRVVSKFFVSKSIPTGIHPRAIVEQGSEVGEGTAVGANAYIGPEVKIGSNCIIMPNVSIYGKVKIGDGCYIEPGAVIGGEGFGFEYNEKNEPEHFPHTGGIIIGDNVYIGSNSTIDRATIDVTIIEDNVKIDNLVHIAHNCVVGRNTLMTGCSTISGGVKVGENCWIAPNSTVYQQLKIGAGSRVGIGAVVIRNVKPGKTVFGNPSDVIE